MAAEARAAEARAAAGDALSDRGDRAGAAREYEASLAAEATNLHALANYAVLCTEILDAGAAHADEAPRLRARAADLYARALAQKPDWFDGHYNRANLLAESGPEGEAAAIVHYREAIKLEPKDADVHNNLSVCLLQAGQLSAALDHAKTAVRLDRARPAFMTNLAELYNATGDTKKATFFAQKSGDPQALLLLAALQQQQGDAVGAEKALRTLIDADRDAQNLAARLRLYSLLAGLEDARDRALDIADQTATLYAQRASRDTAGQLALRLLASRGEGPAEEASEEAPRDGDPELSHAAEMCLLHLKLDDASHLAHKCLVHERLAEAGASEIAPPTLICESDASLAEALRDVAQDSLWYIKDPAVQRGQGIRIVRGPVKADEVKGWVPAGRRVCLQEAVKPALLEGAKFGVRMHVFVVAAPDAAALRVFASRDGILTKCGKAYAHDDTTPLGQITCTSVQRGEAGFDRDAVKGPASVMWEGFQETLPLIDVAVLRSIEAVASRLCARPSSLLRAQLFGYDFCFEESGRPVFIEANISPQFQDAKKLASLRKTLAADLINSVPLLLRPDAAEVFETARSDWKLVGQVPLSSSSSSSSSSSA